MLLFTPFYRKYGVRRLEELARPRKSSLFDLALPRTSLLHYWPESVSHIGPDRDYMMFRHINRPILMSHVTEIGATLGNPRLLATPIEPDIRSYHQKNRRYRRLLDPSLLVRDAITQYVVSYGSLQKRYRYIRTAYTPYQQWYNGQAALWKNVNTLGKTLPGRHQFIQIQLPEFIPGLTDLLRHERTVTQQTVEVFDTPEKLFILHLWRWLATARKESVLNLVQREHLDRINLIFVDSGRWFMVNLGRLDRMRLSTEAEITTVEEELTTRRSEGGNTSVLEDQLKEMRSSKGLQAVTVAKFMLRGLLDLTSSRGSALLLEGTVAQDLDDQQNVEVTNIDATARKNTIEDTQDHRGAFDENDQEDQIPGDQTQTEDDRLTREQVKGETITINEAELDDIDMESFDIDPEELARLEQSIEDDLQQLDDLNERRASGEDVPETDKGSATNAPERGRSYEDGLMAVADLYADAGMLSATQYKRFEELANSYKDLKAPDGSRMEDFLKIDPKSLAIENPAELIQEGKAEPAPEGMINPQAAGSTLNDFDEKYVNEVMAKDIANMTMAIQRAGYAVLSYDVERVASIQGAYDSYTVRVVGVNGTASTLRFRLPVVDRNGTFTVNGVKYKLPKQQGFHLPIKKITPDRVALTSYYGKLFVIKPRIRVANYEIWLSNQIKSVALNDESSPSITELDLVDVFDPLIKLPRVYTALAKFFAGFTVTQANGEAWKLTFNHKERLLLRDAIQLDESTLQELEQDGRVIIGYQPSSRRWLVMTKDSYVLSVNKQGQSVDEGTIESFLGITATNSPAEFSSVRIMGREVPVGFILGYKMGLRRLIEMLNPVMRKVPVGTHVRLEPHEYSLTFSDETLVFSKNDTYPMLFLAGLARYHRSLRRYSSHDFNGPDVYLNVLEEHGISARFVNEVELQYRMFVDPITEEILQDMDEPVTFQGLLIRATELLVDDFTPIVKDRVRGYERFAGALYTELVRSLRMNAAQAGRGNAPLDFSPFVVHQAIMSDPAKMQVKDINPIEDLKQQESMKYSGTGGRSSESMTKETRAYRSEEQGLVSEATVDSANVAINTYTSANPKFNSVRGTYDEFDLETDDPSRLVSTSALVSPGADIDDPKRTNFINIQHGHGIACDGYQASALRTGYEQVLATRTSDMFAKTAKQAGKVISVSADGIIIEYADGTREGFELGRRYGHSGALTFPHDLITNLKSGDVFEAGDTLFYNKGFFEQDYLNQRGVIWKAGMPVLVALMERDVTYEDSSAITSTVAKELRSEIVRVVPVVLRFDQALHRLVRIGQQVASDEPLCVIEGEGTVGTGLFDEATLDTLQTLTADAPRAGYAGKIDNIEVLYNGEMEDMSESVLALVKASNARLAKKYRAQGAEVFTGEVDEGVRVDGNPLLLDTLVIKFYISSMVDMSTGDKAVFGNQLKTIIGQVIQEDILTENGTVIGALFGSKSVGSRMVGSPYRMGLANVLSRIGSKRIIQAYRGKI